MKIMMVVPASELLIGDRLLMTDHDDTRPFGVTVNGVFNTGHARVQVSADGPRWFDASALVCVLRDAQ